MTFPLTFRPTFPFLGGDVSKRTRFGNSETFRRFVQLSLQGDHSPQVIARPQTYCN